MEGTSGHVPVLLAIAFGGFILSSSVAMTAHSAMRFFVAYRRNVPLWEAWMYPGKPALTISEYERITREATGKVGPLVRVQNRAAIVALVWAALALVLGLVRLGAGPP